MKDRNFIQHQAILLYMHCGRCMKEIFQYKTSVIMTQKICNLIYIVLVN